jgi:LysM repeat protein
LVIISTIVVALVLLLPSAFGATPEPAPGRSVDEYVVRSGDTLWEIAEERTAAGEDVRGTITSIRRLNDLDSSMIQPGEVLLVPLSAATG